MNRQVIGAQQPRLEPDLCEITWIVAGPDLTHKQSAREPILGPRIRKRGLGSSEVLVACQERNGYAAPMRWRAPPAIALRMRQITRVVMLVLGILSVPSVGPAAMQRPHCAQHGPSARHQEAHSGARHHMPAPVPASWESATKHDCPHCPATECARVAPCTTSSTAAVSVPSLTVTQSGTNRVIPRRVQHQLYSRTHQPPTPPPQLIS